MVIRLAVLFLLLASAVEATTTVTGHVVDLGTNAVVSNSFARFTLRGCGGNQATVPTVGVLAPTQGAVWFKDFPVNSSGNVSGTIYSTRDATGLLGGDISCGGSFLAVWFGMTIWLNGKPGPEIPVHALNGATMDVSSVIPIQSPPVVAAPNGDSIYCRLDGTNGVCPGAGGGAAFKANGVNLLNPAIVNFINSTGFNGLTFSFTNPSLGNVQLGASGTLNNSGLTNSSLTVNLAAPGTGGGSVALGSTLNLAMPACVAAGVSHAAGLVPDPGAVVNLSTFLRSDCTFQVPAGSGNVSNSGTPAIHQVGVWASATTILGVAVGATGTVLHGHTGADPSFSVVDLAADIGSTKLPIANECPGSAGASSTTFLRGDCVWATPAGGGTTVTIANGIAVLGTSAIASGACATAVTVTATGTATTDNFTADFNADPTGTVGYQPSSNGMLTIIKYPTANAVNIKVCNNTASSITPGAVTLNWRVLR